MLRTLFNNRTFSQSQKGTPMNSEHRIRILERWRRNCLRSSTGNYRASTKFSKRNFFLGVPTIVLTTLAGSSLFATLQEGIDPRLQLLAGFVTLAAAVLSALQTFMGSAERAGKHNTAAAEFNSVKRRIDFLIAQNADGHDLDDAIIEDIRASMDTLSRETPALPESLWEQMLIEIPRESASSHQN